MPKKRYNAEEIIHKRNMQMAEKTEVVVTDVNIKFTSMVVLMVKAALAAIPALIILAIFGAIVGGFFSKFLSV
jgi:hypothetical protein